jgi:hypothetical protein
LIDQFSIYPFCSYIKNEIAYFVKLAREEPI